MLIGSVFNSCTNLEKVTFAPGSGLHQSQERDVCSGSKLNTVDTKGIGYISTETAMPVDTQVRVDLLAGKYGKAVVKSRA